MDDLEQKRVEVLNGLPEDLQTMYSSPASGNTLLAVFTKHQIPEEKYIPYVHTIGDAILGFYSSAEIPNRLVSALQIDEGTAQRIYTDLQAFLAPLKNQPVAAPIPMPSQREVSDSSSTQAEPVPKAEPTVAPLRTLAGDMEKVHGYGTLAKAKNEARENTEPPVHHSSQDDALGRTKLTETPKYDS